MLIGLVLAPFWLLINFIISLLGGFFGDYSFTVHSFDVLLSVLGYGVYFFGATTFCMVVSSISFWLTLDMSWAFIEWVYKKIPGIK